MLDPDTPAALLEYLQDAARRKLTISAIDGAGHSTAYRQIVERQFSEAADRFADSEGRTVEDAFAFACAARMIFAGLIDGTVPPSSSLLDEETLRYGALLVDRLYICLRELSGEKTAPN